RSGGRIGRKAPPAQTGQQARGTDALRRDRRRDPSRDDEASVAGQSRPCRPAPDRTGRTVSASLGEARRLIVKIGSALLVEDSGEIRRAWLDALAEDVIRCRSRGQEILLVSSG